MSFKHKNDHLNLSAITLKRTGDINFENLSNLLLSAVEKDKKELIEIFLFYLDKFFKEPYQEKKATELAEIAEKIKKQGWMTAAIICQVKQLIAQIGPENYDLDNNQGKKRFTLICIKEILTTNKKGFDDEL